MQSKYKVNLIFVLKSDVLEVLEFSQVPELDNRVISRSCQVVACHSSYTDTHCEQTDHELHSRAHTAAQYTTATSDTDCETEILTIFRE